MKINIEKLKLKLRKIIQKNKAMILNHKVHLSTKCLIYIKKLS